MQICVYSCILVISWVGAKMVVASGNNAALGLTTGELSSMFTYTTQILKWETSVWGEIPADFGRK